MGIFRDLLGSIDMTTAKEYSDLLNRYEDSQAKWSNADQRRLNHLDNTLPQSAKREIERRRP